MTYKQVIVMRKDLRLPSGKIGAQAAHAAVESALRSPKNDLKTWRDQGQKKVVVAVQSLEELYTYMQQAKDNQLPTAIITDAGRTIVEPGTVTCGAIGPADETTIDRITGKLPLY